MELTKNAHYQDSIYKWGTLIYTGKTKNINYGMGDYYKAHCFIYKDENFPELFKNKKIYIPNHAIEERIKLK